MTMRRAVVAATALLVLGCAATPHQYAWRPPVPVAAADWEACHARADSLAERSYDRYAEIVDMAGPFGGPFGGVSLALGAWEARENVYEWEMIQCLGARGYDMRAPAPAER
jgi:hypothetical protein